LLYADGINVTGCRLPAVSLSLFLTHTHTLSLSLSLSLQTDVPDHGHNHKPAISSLYRNPQKHSTLGLRLMKKKQKKLLYTDVI